MWCTKYCIINVVHKVLYDQCDAQSIVLSMWCTKYYMINVVHKVLYYQCGAQSII
jgi:hypothetical protein